MFYSSIANFRLTFDPKTTNQNLSYAVKNKINYLFVRQKSVAHSV